MGAVSGESPYQAADIARLFSLPQTALVHGQMFTGRPNTRLHIDDHNILKIRAELNFDEKSATRWIKQILEKERQLNVHIPSKTWFLAIPDNGDQPLIGNICPLLKPLHTLLGETAQDNLEPLDWFDQIWRMYFNVATQHNLRLDEGLSNFGLASDGQIYYLDDDVYNWDCFLSGAQALGVYLRGLGWLTDQTSAQLGAQLRDLILTFFGKQYLTVLAELLRNLFIPDAKQSLLVSLVDALMRGQTQTRSKPPKINQRFIALLADVHSNLPALETVLAFLKQENISEGLVLGDTVGYGPHPAQCIERLQNSGLVIIKGNHDHGLATGEFTKGFSKTAQWALKWNLQQVTAEHRQWLLDLPPMLLNDQWLAVHGSPLDPTFFNAYVYEMTYERNLDVLVERKINLCFHGHTHLPGIYARIAGIPDQHYLEATLDLKRFQQALVCPGSVGQPRNRQIGTQFAIYDREEHRVHFKCLTYPIEKTTHDMEKHDFPLALINILRAP
jgi:predicted phosphodiesterase